MPETTRASSALPNRNRHRKSGYHNERGKTMSQLETQIANRVNENADLAGAQDLIDAHIDAVTGGYIIVQHINFPNVIECCVLY
jgi:hypothetical protein